MYTGSEFEQLLQYVSGTLTELHLENLQLHAAFTWSELFQELGSLDKLRRLYLAGLSYHHVFPTHHRSSRPTFGLERVQYAPEPGRISPGERAVSSILIHGLALWTPLLSAQVEDWRELKLFAQAHPGVLKTEGDDATAIEKWIVEHDAEYFIQELRQSFRLPIERIVGREAWNNQEISSWLRVVEKYPRNRAFA